MKKYNDTAYWGDVVFYSCDNSGTATYRTSDPAGGVDAEFNSPDVRRADNRPLRALYRGRGVGAYNIKRLVRLSL